MHGHRRRSHAALGLTGAAAVLVVGGATATALVGWERERAQPAAAPVADLPARRADRITIEISSTSGFVATVRGADAGRHFLTARDFSLGRGGRYAGEVSAYEPGTFDSAPLRGAAVVDVGGHDAWYVPDYTFAALSADDRPHRSPAIGWPDPSGVWLLVYAAPGERVARDDLIRLAESIHLALPQELRTPFRLGVLPDGLALTYVRAHEEGRSGMVGLSDPRRKASSAATYDGAPYGVSVSVLATAPDAEWAAERASLTGRTTVAGSPAWYSEGRTMLSPEGNGSALVVETEHCVVRLQTADRTAISRTELTRTVQDMTIGDCGRPDSWLTPLP